MQLLPEIEKRRSVRTFSGSPVAKPVIDRIVEAGRQAPSAKNRQAWRFIVITDEKLRSEMQAASYGQEYVGNAPVIIALCTTNVDYRMPNGQTSHPVDLGIAGAFMMLQAEHEGLGTCVVTTFREPEVKSLLSVPHRMRVVMLLLIGEPDSADVPSERAERLPTDRIAGFNHW